MNKLGREEPRFSKDYLRDVGIFLQHARYKPSGRIRHPRLGPSPIYLVTPEAKIRELCTLIATAENDEAANRILADLRDALHKYCEKLRREVAQEMEREYLSSHKDDIAAD